MVKKLPRGLQRMNHVRMPPDYPSDLWSRMVVLKAARSDIPGLALVWGANFMVGPEP